MAGVRVRVPVRYGFELSVGVISVDEQQHQQAAGSASTFLFVLWPPDPFERAWLRRVRVSMFWLLVRCWFGRRRCPVVVVFAVFWWWWWWWWWCFGVDVGGDGVVDVGGVGGGDVCVGTVPTRGRGEVMKSAR